MPVYVEVKLVVIGDGQVGFYETLRLELAFLYKNSYQ
jgi:hypothetical protein